MQNKWIRKILIPVLVLLLIACVIVIPPAHVNESDKGMEGHYAEDADLISVGFSQLGSESVWREANSSDIKKCLSEKNGFLLEYSNARQRKENQIKAIRSFISSEKDFIVFSPVTEEGWETVLTEAKNAGIPVILADRRINTNDDSLYSAWVGSDARAEGEKAGYFLEEYMEKMGQKWSSINIVVLQGNIGSSSQLGRTIGFDSVADTHPYWHILEQIPADFTTAKAKEVMKGFLEKYKKIDVVVCQNDDMAFGAIEAIRDAGKKPGKDIIIISFDAVKDALKLVQQGVINADIECNPEMGEYLKDIILKIKRGEEIDKKNVVEEMVFTIDNVDDYIDKRSY